MQIHNENSGFQAIFLQLMPEYAMQICDEDIYYASDGSRHQRHNAVYQMLEETAQQKMGFAFAMRGLCSRLFALMENKEIFRPSTIHADARFLSFETIHLGPFDFCIQILIFLCD